MSSHVGQRLRIDHTSAGAMSIVAPRGDLDLSGLDTLSGALADALAARPLLLAVDLRGVTFLDGASLGQLLAAGRRCEREGRRLMLVRGGPGWPRLQRVLDASELADRFDIVDGLDQISSGEPTDALVLAAA